MNFNFKAKDKTGKIQEGKIEAQNEKQALDSLQKQEVFVLSLVPEGKGSIGGFSFKKKVSLKDKIIFTKQLAMMVKGGLPLVEALQALQEQTENLVFQKAIGAITSDVQGGLALSKALEKHPKVFSNLYVAVTASGERSGKLDEVLERLADQLQKDYDLISKVKTAVSYPIVIVTALVGVMIIMLVFVVPQLKSIFSEMGVALPLPTRILLGTSSAIITYWYIVIILIVGIYFSIRAWSKTVKGGMQIDEFKIKMPIFGPLVKKIYMASFTRTTGTLVAAGLPMLEILKTVKAVVSNRYYAPVFDQISQDVESGIPLSNALRKHPKYFQVMIPQMISVGEKSGKVDEILFHLATFYDKEVEASTSSLTAMIEPILIILIGGAIGVAIASIIMPIYSLVNVI